MTDDLTDLEALAQAATPGPAAEPWLGDPISYAVASDEAVQ